VLLRYVPGGVVPSCVGVGGGGRTGGRERDANAKCPCQVK
jgi:hypothetical protein